MKQSNKIYFKDIKKFSTFFESVRGDSKVYCTSGGFDPIHIGHVRCFVETAKMAKNDKGIFVVIANNDDFLKRKKGKPFMPQEERLEILSAIKGVDYVVLWGDDTQTSSGAIEIIKPDYFTKGGDRDEVSKIPESDICEKVGCEIIFGVGGGKIQSSSWLTSGLDNDK